MHHDQPYIIGVTGRSGSGKTTLVSRLRELYGDKKVCLHTMDNYYKPSDQQLVDEEGYKNFDLPESFEKQKFIDDLRSLKEKRYIEVPMYDYTVEGSTGHQTIQSAPVILVEGLFIYHYAEIKEILNYKVIVNLSLELAYQRRLKRDVEERNYTEEVTYYRYMHHVEPAYQAYIEPHISDMDLLIDNSEGMDEGMSIVQSKIDQRLSQEALTNS